MLVEVQALLSPNPGGTPRRSVIGWDGGRLPMLLAVLEARGGLRLNATDVYLNIAGGLRVSEPAADLAVAAALVSAATDHADQRRRWCISARSACPARSARSRRPRRG